MLLATVLYRYAKEAQQIQQIVDFAILLSVFLRLVVAVVRTGSMHPLMGAGIGT